MRRIGRTTMNSRIKKAIREVKEFFEYENGRKRRRQKRMDRLVDGNCRTDGE